MSQQASPSLATAVALHSQGRLDEADAIYRDVLARDPSNADALHLHGLVAHQRGLHSNAVSLVSKALELRPGNPAYLNNLGEAHRALHQYARAIDCYQQALAVNPRDGNALNNLGMALHHQHRFTESEAAFARALEVTPNDPEVLTNLGNMLRDSDRRDQALERYQRAVHSAPDFAPAHAWMGVTLYELDRPDAAIASMQRAVELDPLSQETHSNLKRIRWNLNRLDELHRSYQDVCTWLPNSAEAHANLAESLVRHAEDAEALEAAQRAVTLDPSSARARSLLAQAYFALKQYDQAIEQHEHALRLADDDPLLAEEFATALIVAGRPAYARDVLLGAHRLAPRRSGILGRLCIALRELDDPQLAALVDYDRFVLSELIDTPDGFTDLAQFNAALHEELAQQHVTPNHALEQSMRGGTQTQNNLFQTPSGLVAVLKRQIERVIDRFVAGMPNDDRDPFLRFKPDSYVFTGAWSTILHEAGYDGSHIHNEGWLSGTYCVVAPDLTPAQHAAKEGYLQFGEPPKMYVTERNRMVQSVAPEVGRLVLFPSYYWHGVRPFNDGGIRHSVSYDII